ncbi:MAG: hypothetical protein IM516_09095 [Pseudanabaena sp. M158S2SP1A06QC]|jgi:hypothetical protein|nr:hypothetical protein [Pseudanabaena sp. M051S1SP2A07QC]MCA6574329.1 hypothetical protein [Pseudanabaena sp. M53BS1SP1A06MG]MCA6584494.1 hypothetical protein [Pseudanabaena sp. M34BS1SP1A06MG]MCA6588494.1 hypothetical protein [Pseudanabaena sp. M109S1SP1A06QC]MCA6591340.1 hypothetical protein [Pseudanabaena sp. M38BS1SP1A06MG]MCA6595060.1 hypothetical protein [Pseudanabaena sp. M046S1SP1A06QC]MCA6600950.1 hypothetical protein [Pseudanabaena sp. M57BS1SP1A06MG]MCA6603187.1 hypothetical prot
MKNSPMNSPTAISWLDRIGNWNPQLLREIRGKLKLKNLIVAISLSLLFQILLLLFYSQRIPSEDCYAQIRGFGCAKSWSDWWLEQFRFITWTEPFVLFLAGVYSLISDISLEDYKGTLNFIRISPRSSISILIGKIMGVPLLAYIGLSLTIPYHLIAAIKANVPISFLLSFYILLIGTAFLLFSVATLLALLSGWQAKFGGQVTAGALVFSFVTFVWIVPAFMWWNIFTTWSSFSKVLVGGPINSIQTEWWYLPITSNIWTSHIFTIVNLGLLSLAIWRILERRFHNPTATIVSKGQSYLVTLYLEILMLGFCVQSGFTDKRFYGEFQFLLMLFIYIANFFVFLAAIAALTPQRQSLLDWVRFGALSTTEEHPSGFGYVLRDLIWSDKSPAPIAITLNLLITQLPILIWVNSWNNAEMRVRSIIVIASFVMSILILSLVTQLILLLKNRNPSAWATGTVSALIFLPVLIMLSLSITPERYAGVWLFFGFPWLAVANIKLSDIILAFGGQISVIIALSLQLIYQLQRAKMRET